MKIEIEPGAGFCFGVENAVKIAGEALESGEQVYSLGEIVHNDIEVHRLRDLGLVTISYNEFRNLRNARVLIRAHGEPPSTYETAAANNITIIEATCPIVHSIQGKIKKVLITARHENGQIVIFGKEGHSEVIGLLGAAGDKGLLVTGKNDLDKIDFSRPVWLFAQTTTNIDEYDALAAIIRQRLESVRPFNPGNNLRVYNTICHQVSGRAARLKTFARQHDVIVFVSGKKSSNGRMLYDVCLNENKRSIFISSGEEIRPEWFSDAASVGVCGATSTPRWLIHDVANVISRIEH
jgi:4-hydroxy-3-methylbut-2-enyl diphosphate reductase